MSGTERLLKLLALADQGPVMRAALAEEIAELLSDWPCDCPMEMRGPCEALLARALREVDSDSRTRLRLRLDADPALCARVLPCGTEEKSLAQRIRAGESMAPLLAHALGISESRVNDIVQDPSGHGLAVAAKAVGLDRAGFSALALLVQSRGDLKDCYARLDAFDAVSAADAASEWQSWRHPHAA